MPQGTFDIKCNLIGIEPVRTPMDDDLLQLVAASNGQLSVPLLLVQVLRNLKLVEERLNQLEAVSSGPPRFTAIDKLGTISGKNSDSSNAKRRDAKTSPVP